MAVNTVAVLGAGHGGCAAAADLGTRGYSVRLHARNAERLEPLRAQGGIEARGVAQGLVPIDLMTTDVVEAVRDADLIMLVVLLVAHGHYARALAPLIDGSQPIFINPGHTGGGLHFLRELRDAGYRGPVRSCETVDPDLHHTDGGTGPRQHLQLHQTAALRRASGQRHRRVVRIDPAALSRDSAGEQRARNRAVEPQRDISPARHDHERRLDRAHQRRFPILSRRVHGCGWPSDGGGGRGAHRGRKGAGHSGHALHRGVLPGRTRPPRRHGTAEIFPGHAWRASRTRPSSLPPRSTIATSTRMSATVSFPWPRSGGLLASRRRPSTR